MTANLTTDFELSPGDRVCVTGGGGYLGRHVVAALIQRGFRVVITLRNMAKSTEVRSSILAYLGADAAAIEFVEADLTSDDGWELALTSCAAVVHTASPFPDRPPKDAGPLIAAACDGTARVLRIAAKVAVQRAVVTSSIVAVTLAPLSEGRDAYAEQDWSLPDDPRTDAYALSKISAERQAWALADELGLKLTVIHPGLAFGPPIGNSSGTSVGIIERFLRGRDPVLPNAGFPCVDIRDAAQAHVEALLRNDAIGQRVLAVDETRKMNEIAKLLARTFPSRSIKTGVAPDMMIKAAAKFDPTLQNIVPHLGHAPKVDNSRAKQLLGMAFHPIDETIVETGKVLMQRELQAAG